MADNPQLVEAASSYGLPSGVRPLLIEIADYSGQTVLVAPAVLATVSGAEGARTITLLDSASPLTVALAAGAAAIGSVSVSALPADPLGLIADGVVAAGATGSISAKLRRLTTDLDALKTLMTGGATGTAATVATSTAAATLIASNAARKGFTVFNDSEQLLYVKFGATASATSFAFRIDPGGHISFGLGCYTGIITGILDAATGNARVTEIT